MRSLVSWILPVACLGCDRYLATPPPIGLCIRCRGRLKRLRGARCVGCATPVPGGSSGADRCLECRRSPPPYDRLVAVWSYEPPLDAVVQALKFGRLDYLGRALGRAVAVDSGPLLEGFDAIVPVPLHWRRQWARGFNQAEAIARGVADIRRTPLRRLLRRSRPTAAQSHLPRELRLAGPGGAFRCRDRASTEGLSLILVDDVITTGATLVAAADCLKEAGATRIRAALVGRTPAPDHRKRR